MFRPPILILTSGAVSSAVERLVYTERVGGSNPSPPIRTTPQYCGGLVPRRCVRSRFTFSSIRYDVIAGGLSDGGKARGGHFRQCKLITKRGFMRLTLIAMPSTRRPPYAGVAQLVRAPACHAGGRGFEPRNSRHSFISKINELYTSCVESRGVP